MNAGFGRAAMLPYLNEAFQKARLVHKHQYPLLRSNIQSKHVGNIHEFEMYQNCGKEVPRQRVIMNH